jgi:hypothetical protein
MQNLDHIKNGDVHLVKKTNFNYGLLAAKV